MDDFMNMATNLGAWVAGLYALSVLATNSANQLLLCSAYCF